MNLVELTEAIIKRLVADPETVSVKEFDTEEEVDICIDAIKTILTDLKNGEDYL